MSKFLTGKELDEAICNIIWDTENNLLIVSPYIKLDEYFKKLFDKHERNPKIHLILVFGKNEKKVSKSMSKEDFDYFKKFPNISIIYVPNLHAKYYGNEKQGVITSINLYDFSFKNNIEFGVFSQQSLLDRIATSTDNHAWNTCMDIAENNEVVFIQRPVYENKKLIINLSKNYIKSEVLFDSTDKFYGKSHNRQSEEKRLLDFPDELELDSVSGERPERVIEEKITYGFCIRTGVKIPFNPKKPLSDKAFESWNKFKDKTYSEKYCHFSGEKSNGETTFAKPILKKNWSKTKP